MKTKSQVRFSTEVFTAGSPDVKIINKTSSSFAKLIVLAQSFKEHQEKLQQQVNSLQTVVLIVLSQL